MNNHILVVEDDQELNTCLRDVLSQEGYLVQTVRDGTQALSRVQKSQPDLVVLDWGLPTISGDAVCRELKKQYPDMQVVMLTARDQTRDIVEGLNIGADDYITKPFELDELLARVKARLRHHTPDGTRYVVDDLSLDTRTMEVRRGETPIMLSPQEFKILSYLMANKGRVLTREMILSRLWQTNPDIETRVVDVYIGYLRKKVDTDKQKKLIHSIRGFGYKIAEAP